MRLLPGLLALTACTAEIFGPPPAVPQQPPPPPPPPECSDALQVGRSPLHRLTRLEYDQTVAAVLGDRSHPADAFPVDPVAAGFDNVSDVQTTSELHAEKYEAAAWQLADALWWRELDTGLSKRFDLTHLTLDAGVEVVNQTCCTDPPFHLVQYGAFGFYVAYDASILTALDRAGDYTLSFDGFLVPRPGADLDFPDGGHDVLDWNLMFDDTRVLWEPVQGSVSQPHQHQVTVHVETPGLYRIRLWLQDSERVTDPPGDPVAWARSISISRATTRTAGPPLVRRCELAGDGCPQTTFAALLRRAYRRPPTSDELDAALQLYAASLAAGDSSKDAFSAVVVSVLLSPHFLYRVELDPDVRATQAHALSSHELAAKLSYFLSSAPPDDALAAHADDGTLLDPGVLDAEVDRLWADRDTLAQNFGRQLMSTNALDLIAPSPQYFPQFDEGVRTAMGQETDLFFREVFGSSAPVTRLLDAPFTYLNDRLARHYGLPAPGSDTPVRVTLPGDATRGGALALGSVLALNSTPARPSQVLRGRWVLSQLMCVAPGAPPANFTLPPPMAGQTARQQLEAHAANPQCAGCHQLMDPIGFALEHYDADGSYRARYADGTAIDATGSFPDGTRFDAVPGLRSVLAADPRVNDCMAQHLFVYAQARGLSGDDRCQAKAIAARAPQGSFAELVKAIVRSDSFRLRQPEGVAP